jgi:hypothetical protein
VPLTFRLFLTLKKRNTLYFWAILVTSWGLCVREIGYFLKFLLPSSPWILTNVLAQGGWVFMVSGFACVLYSRLNLILESWKVRRYVLALIVFNGVVFHPFMITLSIGLAALGRDPVKNAGAMRNWYNVFKPMERVQIVMFSGQEILISSFYVRCAYQYLRSRFVQPRTVKRAMYLLLAVQAIVVAIDIALIVIDFLGFLTLKLFIHSFVYCVKLELEFLVLNQLVELSQLGVPGLPSFSLKSTRSRATGEMHIDAEAGKAKEPEDFATIKSDAWTSATPTTSTPAQSPRPTDEFFSDSSSSTLHSGRPSLTARTSSVLDQIPEVAGMDPRRFTRDTAPG